MCLLLFGSCGIGFGDIENLLASIKKCRRVANFAVEPNFVVQVRARAATAIAGITDMLLKFDTLAGAYARACQMSIAGFESIAVVNFNHQTVRAFISGLGDSAAQRAVNRRSRCCAEVNARMKRRPLFERVKPHPEITGDAVIMDGQCQWNFCQGFAQARQTVKVGVYTVKLLVQGAVQPRLTL